MATTFIFMSYFYLRSHATAWPMSQFPPDLIWGSINTVVMLAGAIPNHFGQQAAERPDLQKVRLWMVVRMLFSLVFLGVRVLELTALNTRWDSDAYDSAVLTTLTFTGPMEGKRYVDVSENALNYFLSKELKDERASEEPALKGKPVPGGQE